jgi:hypothetical protein
MLLSVPLQANEQASIAASQPGARFRRDQGQGSRHLQRRRGLLRRGGARVLGPCRKATALGLTNIAFEVGDMERLGYPEDASTPW